MTEEGHTHRQTDNQANKVRHRVATQLKFGTNIHLKFLPKSSLVEVEVGVEIGVEVGVAVEVKVRAQNYFFGGGLLEKWRIKQSSNLKLKLELGN